MIVVIKVLKQRTIIDVMIQKLIKYNIWAREMFLALTSIKPINNKHTPGVGSFYTGSCRTIFIAIATGDSSTSRIYKCYHI